MQNKPSEADSRMEALVEKYKQTVYSLAYARTHNEQDAADIFSEVFLRYVRRMPRFESEGHEKAWFIRVTVNCSKSFLASAKRRNEQPLDEEIPVYDSELWELEDYLSLLSPDYRCVIHLFYYEDMPVAEISKALSMKEAAVRMRLTRARRALRELIEGDEDDV